MSNYIGIDIGGTKIAAGIVTNVGQVLTTRSCPTPVSLGGPKILEASIGLAAQLIKESDQKIHGIGIGAGGQIDSDKGLVHSATDLLPGWRGLHITDAFTKEFGLKAGVDNDVNVLGLGEARFGAAANITSGAVVFLALGTGVGGALLSNGALHHGANWSGGEFGHILLTMDPNARRDGGGAFGTLEAYCSGSGLVETWREITGSKDQTITGEDVVADAKSNPGGAGSRAIAKTGEYLGFGLVTLANALDPNLIIIGGGMGTIGDALLDPARAVLKARALPGPSKCPVVPAMLGVNAPIVGAASLVMPKNEEVKTELLKEIPKQQPSPSAARLN
jgi:glucokinase